METHTETTSGRLGNENVDEDMEIDYDSNVMSVMPQNKDGSGDEAAELNRMVQDGNQAPSPTSKEEIFFLESDPEMHNICQKIFRSVPIVGENLYLCVELMEEVEILCKKRVSECYSLNSAEGVKLLRGKICSLFMGVLMCYELSVQYLSERLKSHELLLIENQTLLNAKNKELVSMEMQLKESASAQAELEKFSKRLDVMEDKFAEAILLREQDMEAQAASEKLLREKLLDEVEKGKLLRQQDDSLAIEKFKKSKEFTELRASIGIQSCETALEHCKKMFREEYGDYNVPDSFFEKAKKFGGRCWLELGEDENNASHHQYAPNR